MSVSVLVAACTKSYEILSRIIAQSAPRLNVMDLKVFHSPARIGNASHLAPGLRGTAGDKLQGQASGRDLCTDPRSDALSTQMPCREARNGIHVRKVPISIRDQFTCVTLD